MGAVELRLLDVGAVGSFRAAGFLLSTEELSPNGYRFFDLLTEKVEADAEADVWADAAEADAVN